MRNLSKENIPKKIHYIWFGDKKISSLEEECIKRFSIFAPNTKITKWTEENFDVMAHPYTKKAYDDKKWAFVADYARLKILYDEGGIYLDTDMFLVKDITPLFMGKTFFGKEDDTYINSAIVGARKNDPFVYDFLKKYDFLEERVTIPRVFASVYDESKHDITIYRKDYFYPFSQKEINHFNGTNAPKVSYGVHMWNYSWGNPLVKKFKKYFLYQMVVVCIEKIGMKKTIKKIFKLE